MTKNMGTTDRTLRVLAAGVIAVLYFAGAITGPLAVVLGVLAVVLLVTSAIGWCPLYTPFGLSTRKTAPPSPAGQ